MFWMDLLEMSGGSKSTTLSAIYPLLPTSQTCERAWTSDAQGRGSDVVCPVCGGNARWFTVRAIAPQSCRSGRHAGQP